MAAHDGESGASNEGTSIQFNSVVAFNKLSNEEFILMPWQSSLILILMFFHRHFNIRTILLYLNRQTFDDWFGLLSVRR